MIAIKHSFALVLCLGLLAGSCDVMAESYKARQIDECREYVNLREDPDGESRCISGKWSWLRPTMITTAIAATTDSSGIYSMNT